MNATVPTQINTPGQARLMSLDVFRGATIAAPSWFQTAPA
jgi:predicted acyltransferase